ncbi:MAG: amidohydrolase family protein, partial [Candidatus Acidiferrales bacterium]
MVMAKNQKSADWLITNCSEILTLRGPAPKRGRNLVEIGLLRDGALLVRDGRIAAIGPRRRIEALRDSRRARKLDLGGRVVLPGFVDSHTHLIFAASRAAEYEQRIGGASYEEIARAGGGIVNSALRLRKTSSADLKSRARARLAQFGAHGTTTIEAKSGYGLDWESERKILVALRDLEGEQPIEIARTFLGAHVVPPEFRGRADEYVDLLCKRWIPEVAAENLAEFCDVYCDRGAFSVSQSRRILTAARACGLG